MKKLFLLPLLFCFSLYANENTCPDCTQLALDVGDAYEDAGYDYDEAYQAANWAYEGCIGNGGC